MNKLRMLSLFAGIGGADLAAEWTGQIEVVGQVEIDAFCIRVLEQHWPYVKRMGDIREVRGDEFGTIDLVAGGIPCQPFSSAGKRKGTSDDRYLWPEMFRLVRRCQPTWVVIENVDDFTYLALDIVQTDLESQGYAVQAFVLPACATGAPHIRERCFVVAYADGKQSQRRGNRGKLETAPEEGQSPEEEWQWLWNPLSNGRTDVAYTQHWGRQWWLLDAHQPGATVLCSSSATRAASQSRLGRMFDGISTRLDDACWPAKPGHMQEEWEPSRTVIGQRHPFRRKRLKALGNAIVPYQVFPIFQGIAVWEMSKEEAAS
jgi:DNA (cytosine-5)-methyltransferase 1